MMDLTNLEKATEILKEIKSLDQQIIANEKLAMQLVNGDELVTISINRPVNERRVSGLISSFLTPFYNEEMVTMGEHLTTRSITGHASGFDPKEYTKQVTPPAAVRICQFIHDDLVTRRSKYISQLEKLGFKF